MRKTKPTPKTTPKPCKYGPSCRDINEYHHKKKFTHNPGDYVLEDDFLDNSSKETSSKTSNGNNSPHYALPTTSSIDKAKDSSPLKKNNNNKPSIDLDSKPFVKTLNFGQNDNNIQTQNTMQQQEQQPSKTKPNIIFEKKKKQKKQQRKERERDDDDDDEQEWSENTQDSFEDDWQTPMMDDKMNDLDWLENNNSQNNNNNVTTSISSNIKENTNTTKTNSIYSIIDLTTPQKAEETNSDNNNNNNILIPTPILQFQSKPQQNSQQQNSQSLENTQLVDDSVEEFILDQDSSTPPPKRFKSDKQHQTNQTQQQQPQLKQTHAIDLESLENTNSLSTALKSTSISNPVRSKSAPNVIVVDSDDHEKTPVRSSSVIQRQKSVEHVDLSNSNNSNEGEEEKSKPQNQIQPQQQPQQQLQQQPQQPAITIPNSQQTQQQNTQKPLKFVSVPPIATKTRSKQTFPVSANSSNNNTNNNNNTINKPNEPQLTKLGTYNPNQPKTKTVITISPDPERKVKNTIPTNNNNNKQQKTTQPPAAPQQETDEEMAKRMQIEEDLQEREMIMSQMRFQNSVMSPTSQNLRHFLSSSPFSHNNNPNTPPTQNDADLARYLQEQDFRGAQGFFQHQPFVSPVYNNNLYQQQQQQFQRAQQYQQQHHFRNHRRSGVGGGNVSSVPWNNRFVSPIASSSVGHQWIQQQSNPQLAAIANSNDYETLLKLDEINKVQKGLDKNLWSQLTSSVFTAKPKPKKTEEEQKQEENEKKLKDQTQSTSTTTTSTTTTSTTSTKSTSPSNNDDSENQCSICQSDFETGETLITLPCFHKFHKDCLKQWFDMSHICPVCRFDVNQS